jgi:hypothetical protein
MAQKLPQLWVRARFFASLLSILITEPEWRSAYHRDLSLKLMVDRLEIQMAQTTSKTCFVKVKYLLQQGVTMA